MKDECTIRIEASDFERLYKHLYQPDGDEHGAVLLAGVAERKDVLYLSVREVILARDGADYVGGEIGHRALTPQFIHRQITRARDERLVYLAVHSHPSHRTAGFSTIDMDSHERGYPALLQIARGMPVGAVVFGRLAAQADIWMPNGRRLDLLKLTVVGTTIRDLSPSPGITAKLPEDADRDRQIRMFGSTGQERLRRCTIAIAGLGGVGSLVAEYLARLGIGRFFLIDPDTVELSNLSRLAGATRDDAIAGALKVDVAMRLILQANPEAQIETIADDVAKTSIARELVGCDYLFLAADSMRSRLIVNTIVNQYLIPAVQIGAKIRPSEDGSLNEVMSANRQVRPGGGCLWCNGYIDTAQLAVEAKSDRERIEQAYGVQEPNPSVISLNAVAAAHAVNDFLLDYLSLRAEREAVHQHFHFLTRRFMSVLPRRDGSCSECSRKGNRFGRGDGLELPSLEG